MILWRCALLLALLTLVGVVSQTAASEGILLKTTQDCRGEFVASRLTLTRIGISHDTFIAICLSTAAGVPTPLARSLPFEIGPGTDGPGALDYKLGYRYSPSFLSSPREASRLLGIPDPSALPRSSPP